MTHEPWFWATSKSKNAFFEQKKWDKLKVHNVIEV